MKVRAFKYLLLGFVALAASFSCSGSSKEDPWPDALYCSTSSVQLFSESVSYSLEFISPDSHAPLTGSTCRRSPETGQGRRRCWKWTS